MFSEAVEQQTIRESLLPAYLFKPFPQSRERAAWETIPKEIQSRSIKRAEVYQNFTWPQLLATDFIEFQRSGQREIYEIPHFQRRRALKDLVLGECMEGQGRFLDDIINGIWLICEESYWGVSAHNGKLAFLDGPLSGAVLPDVEEPFIDLFAAETGALLAWTLYLLRDQLAEQAPQVGRRIELELERRIKAPFLHHNDNNWMGYLKTNKVNNWNPWILSNVISVFLLHETDSYRRTQALLKMLEVIDFFLATYGSDGGCDEGTSYWNRAAGSVHDFCEQVWLGTDGRIDFFHLELVAQMGRFIYREHVVERSFVNFADGSVLAELEPAVIYHYGMRIGDEKMQQLAAYLARLAEAGPEEPGGVPVSLFRELQKLFHCSGLQERQQKAEPPYVKDVWLKDIQVMAARETSGSPTGLYLAAKGGHNDESHNHNDVGSCIVYLDGHPALIDLGVELYTKKTFSAERYDIWTMQSGYHNLPFVNQTRQAAGGDYRAEAVGYEQSEEADRVQLTMDIAKAYPPESGLASLQRTYCFDRSGDGRITLTDEFAFHHDGNQVVEVLMSSRKPQVTANGIIEIPVTEDPAGSCLQILHDEVQEIFIEEKRICDGKLHRVWGDQVYRILLQAEGLPRNYCHKMVIRRATGREEHEVT